MPRVLKTKQKKPKTSLNMFKLRPTCSRECVLTLNLLWSAGALAGLTWVPVFCPFSSGCRSGSGELPFSFCYFGPDSESLLRRRHSGVTEAVGCARQTLLAPTWPGSSRLMGLGPRAGADSWWQLTPGRPFLADGTRILHSAPSLST